MRLSSGLQRTLLPGTQACLKEVVWFNLAGGNLKVHLLAFRRVLYRHHQMESAHLSWRRIICMTSEQTLFAY